jgi:predicted amidohydrolase
MICSRRFLFHLASVVLMLLLSRPVFSASVRSDSSRVADATGFKSRADTPPRKVVIGTALARFSGDLQARLAQAGKLLDEAALGASRQYPGKGMDLMVLPEYAILNPGQTAAANAVKLKGPVLEALGAKAREHRTWVVAPMILREESKEGIYTNAAILLNREGEVAGIYRKVYPVADANGVLEGGVTPGNDFPVFECDFGRLGILICWDMVYEEAWAAVARGGAEIVALPSASTQNLRPMAAALRHRYYVVNSTPKNNVSIFDPIGLAIAQSTVPGVLVREIDLAYAVLHWSPTLKEGRAFTARFGSKVGHAYAEREGTRAESPTGPGG